MVKHIGDFMHMDPVRIPAKGNKFSGDSHNHRYVGSLTAANDLKTAAWLTHNP